MIWSEPPSIYAPAQWADPTTRTAILDSFQAGMRAELLLPQQKWAILRDYLDGIHEPHLRRAAERAYPARSIRFLSEDAYRYLPLVTMVAERLSVIFHRPPELRLRVRGEVEPLRRDDPRWGRAVAQWEEDQEAAELDTLLPAVDQAVGVLGQQVISPAFCDLGGGDRRIVWRAYDPHEVVVVPSEQVPRDMSVARLAAVQIRRATTEYGEAQTALWSSWSREVQADGTVRYGQAIHTEDGAVYDAPTWRGAAVPPGRSGYGMLPFVLWQLRSPGHGRLFLPPADQLLAAQTGADLALTDLFWGLRYTAHPQWVERGKPTEAESAVMGPGGKVRFLDPQGDLRAVTPQLQLTEVTTAIEWSLRLLAVAESMPGDMWSPAAARNLAAMQEQREAQELRRERSQPAALRALRRTYQIHAMVANFWRAAGVRREELPPELELHVRLAPLPRVQDLWQAAQTRAVEIQQGLASAAEELMMREVGLSREEAERRVRANWAAALQQAAAAVPGQTPTPATAGGGQPRPADVERG